MAKFDPAVKRQFVAALRSGEYKQCREYLRRGDAFCVLGVLCNLHAQAHPEIAARQKERSRYMGQNNTLPKSVAVWAGIYDKKQERDNTEGPLIFIKGQGTFRLSYANDRGTSFDVIADCIEEQL